MKKEVLLIVITSLFCLVGSAQKQDRLAFLLSKLYDGGKSDYVMIFAHRGDWRNAPENSLKAYQNCIDAEFDGIEIDVQRTKDGELVIMHDKTLDRTTTGAGKVAEKTLKQIKGLQLRNPLGVTTPHKVPTLREVLHLAKGKILIHVDKWQPIKDQIIEIADEEGSLSQLIFRSSWSSLKAKKFLGDDFERIIYIPVLVCNEVSDKERLDDFTQNIKTPAIGFSFRGDDYEVLSQIQGIKNKGFRIWYNTMDSHYNGGHDDHLAVCDLENSYGWLLSRGANILFTDRPFLMDGYMKSIGRR